jgi:hypothetical protein
VVRIAEDGFPVQERTLIAVELTAMFVDVFHKD